MLRHGLMKFVSIENKSNVYQKMIKLAYHQRWPPLQGGSFMDKRASGITGEVQLAYVASQLLLQLRDSSSCKSFLALRGRQQRLQRYGLQQPGYKAHSRDTHHPDGKLRIARFRPAAVACEVEGRRDQPSKRRRSPTMCRTSAAENS